MLIEMTLSAGKIEPVNTGNQANPTDRQMTRRNDHADKWL